MSKIRSTFQRKMKNTKFKKAYEKSYDELLFSELIIAIPKAIGISGLC